MHAAILGGLLGMGGQMINGLGAWFGNRSQQRYNQQQYNQQRQHSLQDWNMQNSYNMDMWNMQNQYNEQWWNKMNAYNQDMLRQQREYDDPKAQMARWKAAGINPHAMYGNMSSGQPLNAEQIAQQSAPSAGATRGAQSHGYTPRIPQFDLTNGIQSILDVRMKHAQIDNVKKANELTQAQIVNTLADAQGKGLHNRLSESTLQTSIDAAAQSLRQQQLQYLVTGNQEGRNQETQHFNVQKLQAEIRTAIANRDLTISQTEASKIQRQILQYEAYLNSYGSQKNDALPFRAASKLFDKIFNKPFFRDGSSIRERMNYNWDNNHGQ